MLVAMALSNRMLATTIAEYVVVMGKVVHERYSSGKIQDNSRLVMLLADQTVRKQQ